MKALKITGMILAGVGIGLAFSNVKIWKIQGAGWFIMAAGFGILQYTGM